MTAHSICVGASAAFSRWLGRLTMLRFAQREIAQYPSDEPGECQ